MVILRILRDTKTPDTVRFLSIYNKNAILMYLPINAAIVVLFGDSPEINT